MTDALVRVAALQPHLAWLSSGLQPLVDARNGHLRVGKSDVDDDRAAQLACRAAGGGKKPLVARFGGIPLIRQRTAVRTDLSPVLASTRRNELIHRLLAECCETCDARTNLEVHHVRKLADLNRPGRREKPAWMHLMAMRRRKSLAICRPCHEAIHAGRPTAPARHDHRRAV